MTIRNLTTGATDFYPKGVTGTSWTPPKSMTDGPYRWWVQAIGPASVRSLWSPPIDIYIGGRPNMLGPVGTTSNRMPTFTWTAISGAASYQLWVNRLDVAQSAVINRSGITSAGFTPTSSLAKGVYRIWIRALSTAGQWSPWSQPVDVTIASSLIEYPLENTIDTAMRAVLEEQFGSQKTADESLASSNLRSSHQLTIAHEPLRNSPSISDRADADVGGMLSSPDADCQPCDMTDDIAAFWENPTLDV